MHFITEQQDETTIFRLRESRLDSRNAGQLKAEFLILAQPDIRSLIVDLSEVDHIDSAGLSALLLAQRQMSIHDGELRLAAVKPDVRSLLEMTQLERVFRMFDTVEEAAAATPSFRSSWQRKAWEDEQAERLTNEAALANEIALEGVSLGPEAPSTRAIRTGAIAAGGSFGAAALAEIMMTTLDDELETTQLVALGDDEEDDLDELDDDFDDDFDEEDDLDEEDEAEKDKAEADGDDDAEEPDDFDEEFEDDDWDDEELEDDDEEDY